jgi:Delta3-Delta2-enoyl-CoA isomerase
MDSGGDYIAYIIEKTKESGQKVAVYNNNNIFYVVMNSGANTFNWEFCKALESAFQEVYDSGDLTGCSLVTLSTHPKIFSNGMDLANIPNEKELGELFSYAGKLLAKFVSAGVPTIAMVNGHAFAAGLYLVISHDYVIMRKEKGYLCFNENQFGAPVNKYNAVLAKAKMGARNYFELYTQFPKINAEEAYRRGIVHKVVSGDEINSFTQQFAQDVQEYDYFYNFRFNTDSKTFAMTKADIYDDVIHSLTEDQGINEYAIKKIFAYKFMLAKM